MSSPPQTDAATRNILVPIDDQEDSDLALRWVIDQFYRSGDVFHFLHIVPPVQHFASTSMQPEHLGVIQAQGFIQDRFVPIVQEIGASHDVSIVEASTDCDIIGQQICHKAEELDAALVVMAAHHKGRLLRYLVGSVTKYCVNKCRQTVLVMH